MTLEITDAVALERIAVVTTTILAFGLLTLGGLWIARKRALRARNINALSAVSSPQRLHDDLSQYLREELRDANAQEGLTADIRALAIALQDIRAKRERADSAEKTQDLVASSR